MAPQDFTLTMPAPAFIWGCFERALGVMYFMAIVQLYPQVIPLAGARGATPVCEKLARIRVDYPGWRHWLYFPTLLWFNASDRFLKGLIVVGASAALLASYGGPFAGVALLGCWLVYLSLDIALGLSYPWDCLLLEAGFLGLFLPALPPLPELTAASLPIPAVAWAYRWLFFRVLFGFGKYKYTGGSLRDSGYFKSFMNNIPLPTYLARYAYRLPLWVFRGVLYLVFFTEVVLPFGVFVGGNARLVVAGVTAVLMIGIQLVSNFGFFNLLTIVLCIPLLDRKASLFDTSLTGSATYWFANGVILFLAVGGLVNLPFNSWCTFTWLHWPSGQKIRLPLLGSILAFYRKLIRFRLVHAYGVFPAQSSPPIRWVPVIEGTENGLTWHPYEYRYMITTERTPPRFVAPYHPRLDHGVFYEAFGTNESGFTSSIIGAGNPYDFSHSAWMACLVQRLLEGEPTVHTLFRTTPFRPEKPPKAIRVNLYRFQVTTPAERRQTGHWWVRTFAGTHLEPVGVDKQVWTRRWPDPVRFYPDAIQWKRWAPRTRALLRLGETNAIEAVWQAATAGLTVSLPTFWDDFMNPATLQANESGWAAMPDAVARLRATFRGDQLDELETILGRLSLALLGRLEPHYLGKALPPIPVSEYFQLTLLTHHIISKGPAAYEAVLQNPAHAIRHLADFEPERSFYYLGLFWFDTLVFQARKFRLTMQISSVKPIKGLPGFQEMIPFISRQFTTIGCENLPQMRRNPANGEWVIQENQPHPVVSGNVKSDACRS